MKNNYVKYVILSFLGFLTVKRHIHFGDYCSEIPDGIQCLFFCFIFIVTSITTVVYDVIKSKIDYKVFVIISIIILLNLIFLILSPIDTVGNKEAVLKGSVDNIERNKQITFNKNKSFIIELHEIEWTCYKKGDYEIKDNILTLKKDNLIKETNSLFTYKYRIELKNRILIPLEKGFNTITIDSTNQH
jgi:hypothetical protein